LDSFFPLQHPRWTWFIDFSKTNFWCWCFEGLILFFCASFEFWFDPLWNFLSFFIIYALYQLFGHEEPKLFGCSFDGKILSFYALAIYPIEWSQVEPRCI
jgi:hypothetical protein